MNSLFVNNLPYDLSGEEFRAAFEQFGAVSSVNIATEFHYGTRRSRGYGFVDFVEEASLRRALAAPSEIVLKGRTLGVREARPHATITDTAVVSNLTDAVTVDALTAHFARYQPVEAKIVHAASRDRPGFGYAKFGSQQNRDQAIEALNGTNLAGATITVRPATRPFRTEEEQQSRRRKEDRW
jgi:RNA recognition motif-containing protein